MNGRGARDRSARLCNIFVSSFFFLNFTSRELRIGSNGRPSPREVFPESEYAKFRSSR